MLCIKTRYKHFHPRQKRSSKRRARNINREELGTMPKSNLRGIEHSSHWS